MENETGSLTSRQRAMLEFERTWWQSDEPRADLIATRFGCSADQYADELAEVLALPAALARWWCAGTCAGARVGAASCGPP